MSVVFRHDLVEEKEASEAAYDADPPQADAEPDTATPGLARRVWSKCELMGVAMQDMSVALIVFLVYFGWSFGSTVQAKGVYERICEITENETQCAELSVHDALEDRVQRETADWAMYQALAYFSPAIVVDTLLGAYGDKYGRQITILLGIFGVSLSEFGYLLTLSETVYAPFWFTLVFGFMAGMTGFIAMVPVSCNAYLADQTADHDLLTVRAGILSAAQSLATVLGGLAAALVQARIASGRVQLAAALDLELAVFGGAFALAFCKIPQRAAHRRRTLSGGSAAADAAGFFRQLGQLLRSGFAVYTRRRLGHRRAFLFVMVLMLVVSYTTMIETRMSPLIHRYVFRTKNGGLGWDAYHLGIWNGMGYMVLFLGTFVFLPVFKRVLRLRETSIMLVALCSSAARSVLIGLARATWHMHLANAAGLFAGMVQPALVSFIVQLVPAAETGRAFALFGVAADLAFIATNLVYNHVYKWTVGRMPGFTFLFIGAVELAVAVLVAWVHWLSGRERIGHAAALSRESAKNRVRAVSSDVATHEAPFPSSFFEKRHSLFAYDNFQD